MQNAIRCERGKAISVNYTCNAREFSMAFYSTSIRVPTLINNVYYKFTINAFKLHLSRRQVATKSKHLSYRRGRNAISSSENQYEIQNLSEYIEFRKSEARKSIVVQIASWKSCKNLLSHCSQFGEIANAFYYVLPKDHQFVLLEYKSLSSVKNALNAATYVDRENIVPGRTNVMWFRKLPMEITKNITAEELRTIPFVKSTNYALLSESRIKQLLVHATSVSAQMTILYDEYRIPELEIRLKFQIITSLEQYFSGIFPSVVIHPFGSFINGFGKKLSDLDVVLFADGLKKENTLSRLVFHTKSVNTNEKQQTHEFMGVLADTMRYMIPGISNVRKIFNARVPIIKFNNIFTHTECDLSMSNVIATYMTELLFVYGELDKRVRPLVFTIRKWAQDNKLTNRYPGKTISNFSLTLLVIFYLQRQQILPPINQLQGFEEINASNNKFLDHVYLYHIHSQRKISKVDCNLGNLLCDFFTYYYNFNFSEYEICLREGFTFKKRDNQPLHIRNPFERNLNVSKNVTESEIDRMKSLMIIALSNLKNTKSMQSKNWGILSICNFPETQSASLDISRVLEKEDNIVPDNKAIPADSETIENIEKSNIVPENKAIPADSETIENIEKSNIVPENKAIPADSETIENIEKSNVDNILSTETREKVL